MLESDGKLHGYVVGPRIGELAVRHRHARDVEYIADQLFADKRTEQNDPCKYTIQLALQSIYCMTRDEHKIDLVSLACPSGLPDR